MTNADFLFLVVEDNAIDQLITGKLLNKIDCQKEVHFANNGEEGIQWLSTFNRPEGQNLIILLDLKMPVMDGFGFLSAYENLTEHLKKNAQIFILSSTLNAEEINRGKSNRYVRTVLTKPLPLDTFTEMIF